MSLRAFQMKFVNVGSKSPNYFFGITDAQSRQKKKYIKSMENFCFVTELGASRGRHQEAP